MAEGEVRVGKGEQGHARIVMGTVQRSETDAQAQ